MSSDSIANAAVERALRVARRLDSVRNVMTGLGGRNDKGTQVEVDTARVPLDTAETDALTRYDGYAVKWIERVANEATLTGWDIKSGFDTIGQFLDVETYVRDTMREGLRVGMGSGSALVLIMTKDGGSLSTPLNVDKVQEVQALHVFDDSEFEVAEYEWSLRKPGWRRAKFWQISPSASATSGSRRDPTTQLQRVHHSRCLYIPGRELLARLRFLNGGKDDSLLDSTWDPLKDMRGTDQGLAVLAQEMKQDVIKMGGLEGVDASTLGDVFRERLQTLAASKGLLNVLLLSEGDEFQTRAAVTSGAKDLKGAARSTWAAVTGMPEVIGFGATPGGLNTDGEAGRRGWDREIRAIQETHLRRPLERLYEIYASAFGYTDRWKLDFRDLGTQTPMERAQTRRENAMTDRIYRQEGILSPDHIRESRFGEDGYGDIRPMPEGAPVPGDPTRALNGPQATALLEVILQVATERLPREAGVEIIIASFNLDRGTAEAAMGDVGRGFTIEPEIAAPAEEVEKPDLAIQAKNQE